MSFFSELKRRNVIRAGIAYAVFAWLLLQIVEFVLEIVGSPLWIIQSLVVLAIAGLPGVMVFAWVFELTPEGIKRDAEVDREKSIRPHTAHRLETVTIVCLAMAVAFLMADRHYEFGRVVETSADEAPAPAPAESTSEPDRKAIAVLPFHNLSTEEENEFFAAGVHEDILTYLTRIADLKVNSPHLGAQVRGHAAEHERSRCGAGRRFHRRRQRPPRR